MNDKLSRRLALNLLLGLLASPALCLPGYADGGGGDDSSSGSGDSDNGDRDDHDDDDEQNETSDREQKEIRDAVEAKKSVPLAKLLSHVRLNYDGEILDVRFRKSSGNYFYFVKMLSPAGRIFILKLDAKTLAKV